MIPWPPVPPPADTGALAADMIHVQLALPVAGDVWDKAKWDTATWDAISFSNFVDVSCDTPGVSIERGRPDPLGHVQPARISFNLDNPSGLYSPWNTVDRNGADLGGPVLGPDVPVRVATVDGSLVEGFVVATAETDDGGESTVAVNATDALSYLGDANGLAQSAQGAGETAGPRLARILNAAQTPGIVDRNLAPGTAPLQATTLAGGALAEAWLTADSDGGVVWCTKGGVIRYADPAALGQPEFSEPVARFADAANEAPDTVCPISFTTTRTRSNVKNVVSVAYVGGTAQTVTDPGSVARHGQRSVARYDLIHQSDAWSIELARAMLKRLAGAELAVSPIDLVPTDDTVAYTAAMAIDLGSRIQLDRDRFGQHLGVLATVDAITHTITLDQWTMTIRCSPGPQLAGYTRWNSAAWDSSVWDRSPSGGP